MVSALGASIFFSNAIMLVYGARSQVYPNGILPSVAVSLLGVDIPLMRIVMFVGTVVLMLLLYGVHQPYPHRDGHPAPSPSIDTAKLMAQCGQHISMIFLIGPALGGAARGHDGAVLRPDHL